MNGQVRNGLSNHSINKGHNPNVYIQKLIEYINSQKSQKTQFVPKSSPIKKEDSLNRRNVEDENTIKNEKNDQMNVLFKINESKVDIIDKFNDMVPRLGMSVIKKIELLEVISDVNYMSLLSLSNALKSNMSEYVIDIENGVLVTKKKKTQFSLICNPLMVRDSKEFKECYNDFGDICYNFYKNNISVIKEDYELFNSLCVVYGKLYIDKLGCNVTIPITCSGKDQLINIVLSEEDKVKVIERRGNRLFPTIEEIDYMVKKVDTMMSENKGKEVKDNIGLDALQANDEVKKIKNTIDDYKMKLDESVNVFQDIHEINKNILVNKREVKMDHLSYFDKFNRGLSFKEFNKMMKLIDVIKECETIENKFERSVKLSLVIDELQKTDFRSVIEEVKTLGFS